MTGRIQRGMGWWKVAGLRLLAGFCLTLMLVASTAQVCHTHEDLRGLEGGKASTSAQAEAGLGNSSESGSTGEYGDSAVRCAFCVAMHGVVPVVAPVLEVAIAGLEPVEVASDDLPRMFRWRFEMASRPPPSQRTRA